MHDNYDDIDPEKGPQGSDDGEKGKVTPAPRIPDELPPVRIGEVGKGKPKTPEQQENLRERSTDPGFDTDDTIDGLPLDQQNPTLQSSDPEKKIDNRPS